MMTQQPQGSLPSTGQPYDVALDTMPVKGLDPDALILRLDKMFREAVDHPTHVHWLHEADLDHKFYEGEQWSKDEKAQLEDRNQAAIVENEIHPVIEDISGQYQKQRTTVKFTGHNAPVDDALANGMSDLMRHVDQQTDLDFEEGQQAKDGFISGRGVMEIGIDVNELGEPEITQQYDDTFNYFPDPYSRRYDWNKDARYICRAKWMDMEAAQMRWPDKAEQLQMCANAWLPSSYPTTTLDPEILQRARYLYYNNQRKQIRPVETWYKELYRQSLYHRPDGKVVDVTGEVGTLDKTRIVERTATRMWVSVHCAGVLISHQQGPYDHVWYPFVPYFCFRKKDGEPYGYVRNLRDPQSEINHRRSRALYMLNNQKVFYEQGAIEDPAQLGTEMARADGQVVIAQGKFDKFREHTNQDIGQANLEMLQESKTALRTIAFGQKAQQPQPELRSGAGLARKQAEGALVNMTALNNFRLTRRIRARIVFALIKQYFTGEMVFEITDDPNVTRTVKIPASHFDRIKEEIYDVVIEDATDYLTSRQEQQDMLMTNLPQWLKFGPAWAKIMIGMSDLKEKKGLIQQIDQSTQPPPPEPKVSITLDWSKLAPAEKAAWAIKLGMPEMAKIEMAGQGVPPEVQVKTQTDLIKTAMKTKVSIEQGKLAAAQQLSAQQHEQSMGAMDHASGMVQQQDQQAHEQALQAQQHDHEQQLAQMPPPGGASGA